MSGSQPAPSADDTPGPGILGSLPRTRPAVRSPRRAESAGGDAHEEAAETPDTPRTPPQESPAAAERTREQELEDLAKAGISLAGGAATLGLRVAGRAAAALRDAVERR